MGFTKTLYTPLRGDKSRRAFEYSLLLRRREEASRALRENRTIGYFVVFTKLHTSFTALLSRTVLVLKTASPPFLNRVNL
jgi:hypothetical protein